MTTTTRQIRLAAVKSAIAQFVAASTATRADDGYEDRVDDMPGVELSPVKRFPDGRLVVEGALTRSGIFIYRDPKTKKEIREYRPDSEVFNPKSMATLEGAWVTNNHPPGLITSKTAKEYSVGAHLGVPRRDGNRLVGKMVIGEDKTGTDMEHGKVRLSCGYRARINRTPGVTPNGERYHHSQHDIVYNHVAVVYQDRDGGAYARMDSAQAAKKERKMALKDKDKGKNDAAALQSAVSKMTAAEARAAEADGKLEAAEGRADAAEGRVAALEERIRGLEEDRLDESQITERDEKIEELTVRCDEAEAALAAVPDMIAAAVKNRVGIEKNALIVMGDEFKMDDLSDKDIMLQVVSRTSGVEIDAERSLDYIRARFDGAMESFVEGEKALGKLRDDIRQKRGANEPQERVDAAAVKQKSDDARKKAWQKPLPSTVAHQSRGLSAVK